MTIHDNLGQFKKTLGVRDDIGDFSDICDTGDMGDMCVMGYMNDIVDMRDMSDIINMDDMVIWVISVILRKWMILFI